MQLAWNEFKANFAQGDPLKFKTENKKALEMTENFNRAKFKQSDIDASAIYVQSGFGQATLDLINK